MTASATKRVTGNLPSDLTSFVGRQREVADVKQALSSFRLVTLTGTGGVGKTRLALRAAGEVRRAFEDGVWFVDIVPVREDDLLAPTIAQALDLQSRSQRWAPNVLSSYLTGRRLLLVLDNCEHLAYSCAVIADALLRACPQLRVLATSRQPLDIAGEHLIVVHPLSIPAEDARVGTPEALGAYDAVRLFAERARAVAPGFHITAENHAAVARLCQRLDGVPLALELAAARLRVLSPHQILERLDGRYAILRSGSQVAAPRQRSLRSLIDWSYDLCAPDERTLWARLTVFPSNFSVEAVEEICGGDDLPREALLHALAGLVDKSIVSAEHIGGGVRYRMLEIIRTYGHERLAALGQEATLRRRHRDYFARVMAEWYADWFGPRQMEMLAWMRVERDNLRTAIDGCLSEQDFSKAVLLASAVGGQTFVHGFLAEGRYWMGRVLAAFDTPSLERARLLWVDGWHALNQGDAAGGVSRFEASREVAERIGDVHEAAMATVFLGVAHMIRGDVEAAAGLYEDALAGLRGMDDPMGSAVAASRLGAASFVLGDAERAVALCNEAIEFSEACGELWHRAEALWELSIITWQQGDLGRATELAMESLRTHRDFGDAVGTAQCLETLAWIAESQALYERAARLLGSADALWRDIDASLFTHMAGYHERCEKETQRVLGMRSFSAIHYLGANALVSENVAYALGEQVEEAYSVRDGTADAQLTNREVQIAALVARGLSNKEIAAQLVISQRTAEGHVEHILNKLGFASRAQIAAWVTERRAASNDR
jgi:predicted ATPase/DNA-binding CsgD family transcriptional regulator